VKLYPERELTRCREILDEIRTLFARTLDKTILRTAATKLAHLKGRLGRLPVEPGAQMDVEGRLCADLDRVIAGFKSRAKFFNEAANVSTRSEPSLIPGFASTPLVEPVCGPGPSWSNHNWAQVVGSWGIAFQGDRKDELSVFDFLEKVSEKCASHDLPQDDLLRHAKMLFRGEALVWYRMIESRVSSWADLCEFLKEEFLPIGYSETARENLLKYRQTERQSVGMFLARFEQLEGYLSTPLPFAEKMAAIQKNVLPYYQDRLWDKEIASPDDLYRLCRRLDATRFNIDQHVVVQRGASSVRTRSEKTTTASKDTNPSSKDPFCHRCKQAGHEIRNCPSRRDIKCWGCGKSGFM
jgi:hypothetical protein